MLRDILHQPIVCVLHALQWPDNHLVKRGAEADVWEGTVSGYAVSPFTVSGYAISPFVNRREGNATDV